MSVSRSVSRSLRESSRADELGHLLLRGRDEPGYAMLDQLGNDYVRTARAKGASRLRVWLHHALRNALLPLVALGGLQIGNMLAFTLLTETVFQWPGMGFLFLEAVTRADVPLITTYLVAVGFLFVVTNTLADMVCLWLDPRISLEARQ